MILALLIAAQAAPAVSGAPRARFDRCTKLAVDDPAAGARDAQAWAAEGGGFIARQCLGLAYANGANWPAAADAFSEAARGAELAHDPHVAQYWAQAGNAWLAGGDAAKARAALDAALAAGTLTGLPLGEAQLDRARAFVAAKDLESARADLDQALANVPADPLAWLLSATLARRMDDLPRARKDIAEALRLAEDDASVQLEAGNIAALAGDTDGARAAWGNAARRAPDAPAGKAALAALAQFDAPTSASTPKP